MGGGKLLSLLSQTTKSGSKIATLAPLALVNHNFVAFGLFALAVAPFILVAPAHADSISIDLDATAVTLQRSGNLYEHTSSLHVHNSNTYGFTLSMNTSQPNLVNSKDSSYKIDSVSGTNQKLAADQWGYGMGKNATTFSSVSSASLADITSDNKGSCTSVDDCTLYLTFGANIDPKHLPTGSYSTSLTYTATSKPAPYVPPTPYVPPDLDWDSICRDRYPGNDVEAIDKQLYCNRHQGNMSGYQPDRSWICRSRYPGNDADTVDKEQYCRSHGGDMSGYQPDWDSICYNRYPNNGVDNNAENNDKRWYCSNHHGDMSGYQPDWRLICTYRYLGTDAESRHKQEYCRSHGGDMSGYDSYNP